jgi:hypothetical protein
MASTSQEAAADAQDDEDENVIQVPQLTVLLIFGTNEFPERQQARLVEGPPRSSLAQ